MTTTVMMLKSPFIMNSKQHINSKFERISFLVENVNPQVDIEFPVEESKVAIEKKAPLSLIPSIRSNFRISCSEKLWIDECEKNFEVETREKKEPLDPPTSKSSYASTDTPRASFFFLPNAIDQEDDVTPSDSTGDYFTEPDCQDSISTFDSVNRTESMKVSSYPTRSILKTSVDESIPICTKKRSWSKLPIPDLENVKLKRTESMNSFFHPCTVSGVRRKKLDSKVSFENILIREYGQTIGDNPSVTYGTPVSLDWVYEENEPLDIDSYEIIRGKRRTNRQMYLNHYQRKNLLIHSCGFTEEEVNNAKYETKRVKSQRDFSRYMQTTLKPLIRLEEMRESAIRKMKRRSAK
jgi:hypothetical protein